LEAHNQSALRLKTRLFFQPAVIVASVPYQLQSSHSDDTAASTTPPTWQTWLPAIPLRADATHRAEPLDTVRGWHFRSSPAGGEACESRMRQCLHRRRKDFDTAIPRGPTLA